MFKIKSFLKKIKTLIHHYKCFKKDQKKFENSDIAYYNFWTLSRSEDCWFTQFIKARNINTNHKKINFFSVFGSPHLPKLVSSPKIFYTGENIQNKSLPNFFPFSQTHTKNYDLSLGFDYSDHEKYLRFPLWILYLIPPEADLETIEKIIAQYNNPEHRLSLQKTNFCVNISRHDINGLRTKIIHLLEPVHKVTCAGNFLKNTNDLKEKFGDQKIEYLKIFKFNICPENSDTEGYVTEKLFEAIIGGSVPIYWGSNNRPEPTIINEKAILFFDEKNPQALYDTVEKLWEDKQAYKEFCQIKPFHDNAAEEIWHLLNKLENRIKELL